MSERAWRPSREQLAEAYGTSVPDVVAARLLVLFCGINPGLYSGAVGHHFARPGNRFWKALHASGFTDRVLSPFDERELVSHGVGVTNLVNRTTAGAAELSPEELRRGAEVLERKVCRFRPGFVAFLGMTAYRTAFRRPAAGVGLQPELLCGSRIWVLPNPSGLNAHYQLSDLAKAFAELRRAASGRGPRTRRPPPGREGRR